MSGLLIIYQKTCLQQTMIAVLINMVVVMESPVIKDLSLSLALFETLCRGEMRKSCNQLFLKSCNYSIASLDDHLS